MFTDANDTLILASVMPPALEGFESVAAAADEELQSVLIADYEDTVREFLELAA